MNEILDAEPVIEPVDDVPADDSPKPKAKKQKPCVVTASLNKMKDADADAVREAMNNPKVTDTSISAYLRKNGYSVGRGAVAACRNGSCDCAK